MLPFAALAAQIERAVAAGRTVPLLVLRLPEFERIAWREGKGRARRVERVAMRAFARAARCVVRDEDAIGHESGSDRFAVAMLAPARLGRPAGAGEARAALERIAAAMSLWTGLCMETGWWPVERCDEATAFSHTLDAALERGGREREHRELLAAVGHELRTPLTSISGYIETLLDDEELDAPTSRRFLQTARREALRLGRLVDGMLEFSMLDLSARANGRCDAADVLRATVDAIAPLAAQRAIAVRALLPPSTEVRMDADACAHVGLNLLENAVKYGRERGVVELRAAASGVFLAIAVDDDGPGIAPGEREAIFGLGIRGSTHRPGTGIGLAIVKTLVERAGGDVRVARSRLGGAQFLARVPLA